MQVTTPARDFIVQIGKSVLNSHVLVLAKVIN